MTGGTYTMTILEAGIIHVALEGDISHQLFEEYNVKRVDVATEQGFDQYVLIVDTSKVTHTERLDVRLAFRMAKNDPRMKTCLIMGKMLVVQILFKILSGTVGVKFEMANGMNAAMTRARQILGTSAPTTPVMP